MMFFCQCFANSCTYVNSFCKLRPLKACRMLQVCQICSAIGLYSRSQIGRKKSPTLSLLMNIFKWRSILCPEFLLFADVTLIWMALSERRTKRDPFSDEFIPILTKCIADISHYRHYRQWCTFFSSS